MGRVIEDSTNLKIEYLKPQGNLTIYENFDRCISYVESEYFIILGDDDLIGDSHFFLRALEFLSQNNNRGMVCGRVCTIENNDIEKISAFNFYRSDIVNPYTHSNLLYKLPFPTITGCIFRTSSFRNLKFCSYNHRSADTSLLFEILIKRECFFINSCPTIMINHDKNDHLNLNREEIKKDLAYSFANCVKIANVHGLNSYQAKIIYSFFVMNRLLMQHGFRYDILRTILKLKGYNCFYVIITFLILSKKRLFQNSIWQISKTIKLRY